MANQNSPLVSNDTLNYDALLKRYPWLVQRDQQAIISPDVDGILCGLLMSHYFNWKIVGFYDGRDIAVKQGVDVKNCVFLDMDIFRKDIRSCGHNVITYNKNDLFKNREDYSNCVNPNLIRRIYASNKLKKKYPFGTIHFLLCIFGSLEFIKNNLTEKAVSTLLYADGTVKKLFSYPETCADWFEFLNVKNSRNPVHSIFAQFADTRFDVLLNNLKGIINSIKQLAVTRGFGRCKIKIQDSKNVAFPKQSLEKFKKLVSLLAQNTGWDYVPQRWSWTQLYLSNISVGIQ